MSESSKLVKIAAKLLFLRLPDCQDDYEKKLPKWIFNDIEKHNTGLTNIAVDIRQSFEEVVEIERERDKYRKALEQCLIVLSCMNDLTDLKRQCKCIDIIEEALNRTQQ